MDERRMEEILQVFRAVGLESEEARIAMATIGQVKVYTPPAEEKTCSAYIVSSNVTGEDGKEEGVCQAGMNC